MLKKINFKSWLKALIFCSALCAVSAYADNGGQTGLSGAADKLTDAVVGFVKLVLSIAEIAGFAFGIAGIMKFKQHKENPAQTTLSQPITLFLIGVALIWLPTLMGGGGIVGGQNITSCFKDGKWQQSCLDNIGGGSGK